MIKKVLGLALAAIVSVSVVNTFAGDGCCAAGKSAKGAKAEGCPDAFGKLNLTDKQKTQMTALMGQVKNATSKSEAKQIFEDGAAKILTPEQLAQCKSMCEKAGKDGACPFSKASACTKS